MNCFKIYYSLIIIFLASQLYSQDLSKLPSNQLKGLAKSSISLGDYLSAIDYYEAFLKKKSNATVMFSLAECYRHTRNYEEALKWYKKAYKTDSKKQITAQYFWATMLMTQRQYSEANELLKQFKNATKKSSSLKEISKAAQIQIESCQLALKDSGNVLWITEIDSSINRKSAELSPFFLNENTMVYSSLRTDTVTYTLNTDGSRKEPVRQFYLGKRNDKNWKFQSEWLSAPFNKPSSNTANGAFSPDGNRFYFTRCERNWKNKIICSIYQSTKEANTWSVPIALPKIINNPKYTSTHPAVATFSKRNEEILYFVSNRKGGRGGLDIWYTQFKKKQNIWTEPKNCGNKINTSGNEITPFVEMENRTLYFSSDGMSGWGQLDIYKSTGELSKWMPCENIKPPLNSPFDDLYFNLNKNLTDGFIVSNRPSKTTGKTSTCCDDILIFKFDEVIRIKAIGTVYARIDKSFKKMFEDKFDSDKSTSDAMNADSSFQLAAGTVATLFIIDDTAPMGSGNMIYIKSDTIDINGNYSFNLDAGKEYVIEIENYGYYKPRLNISTFMYTQSDTMYLDTLSIDIMPKQPLIVKNIYYEFGESELSYKAKKILDSTLLSLLQENSQLIIEVSSHTDNKGRTKLNKDLSQERATKVVSYLIKKGIEKERLYAVGYGETKPIAPNEMADGKDNPDGREKNRRTEFKIIGSLNQYSEIIYEE